MRVSKITEVVEAIALPIVERENMELVDVEFVKEGPDWFLRVYIDKPGGVDLDDCVNINEQLSEKLNDSDPIEKAYYLDVSSPGAERPLKKPTDFERAIGKNVYIKTFAPIEGAKEFEGILTEYDGETAVVETRIKTRKKAISLPVDKIAQARLAVTFS